MAALNLKAKFSDALSLAYLAKTHHVLYMLNNYMHQCQSHSSRPSHKCTADLTGAS